MKIVHNIAVLEHDTHMAKWVEQTGKIDHGLMLAQYMRQFINPGDWVVDVGALYGDHTVPYAELVGASGRVFAFEPQHDAFECLRYNTAAYPWINIYKLALSNRNEMLQIKKSENVGASCVDQLARDASEQVFAITLDSLGLDRLNFMKIDVEGFELHVLKGAEETLRRHMPTLMIEISTHMLRYETNAYDMTEFLRDVGYRTTIPSTDKQLDFVVTP